MRQAKKDVTLCEKDALIDLLDCEKGVLARYLHAIGEGSAKPLRRTLLKLMEGGLEAQFSLFEQLRARGYYEVELAPREEVEGQAAHFSKVKKTLADK